MKNTEKSLLNKDGEVRELTLADLQHFQPATEVLPLTLQKKLHIQGRGPQHEPTKERISIRLSADVLQAFRTQGPGWQTRIDEVLKDWVVKHS
ncbi:BrnA antitoxin family protein [Paenalcaligenes faecalis]|uniref:BrnA antitoxin family protein n=1 Tax=Paenalcaligenes faecalis TaxID=2980099 RepID=UPI0022B97277|nr:BrnA antitoxin family protein [Paenalcaligenes faecalis]